MLLLSNPFNSPFSFCLFIEKKGKLLYITNKFMNSKKCNILKYKKWSDLYGIKT